MKSLSRVQLVATPWIAAYQGFSRQEYWSGVPLPSPNNIIARYTELNSLNPPKIHIYLEPQNMTLLELRSLQI